MYKCLRWPEKSIGSLGARVTGSSNDVGSRKQTWFLCKNNSTLNLSRLCSLWEQLSCRSVLYFPRLLRNVGVKVLNWEDQHAFLTHYTQSLVQNSFLSSSSWESGVIQRLCFYVLLFISFFFSFRDKVSLYSPDCFWNSIWRPCWPCNSHRFFHLCLPVYFWH